MRRTIPGRLFALTALLLVLCTVAVYGAEQAPPRPRPTRPLAEYNIPALGKPFEFNTVDAMDLERFVRFLASPQGGGDLNVAFTPGVSGSVKLSVKGITVGEALEIALAANRLAYEVKGEGPTAVIEIMPDEDYRNRHGVSFYEERRLEIISLNHAKPSSVTKVLEGLKSERGRIIWDDATGTLVLIDTPTQINEMKTVLARTDPDTVETRSFTLQFADPEKILNQVKPLITPSLGRAAVNAQAKTLIVTDHENVLEDIASMVRSFDTKPKQVAIQAKVVQVSLNDDFSMGVSWSHFFDSLNPRFRLSSQGEFPGPSSTSSRGGTLTYRTILGGADLSILVDALKEVGDTRIVSNPRISVLDGEEATIKVTRTRPYEIISYEPGTTNVVGRTFEFVEVGAILSVTPKISENGFITVAIKPTISSMEETTVDISIPPVVKTSEAETTVVVKDGVTIMIGGMIESERVQRTSAIPVLGKIPLLGALFRSAGEVKNKIETVVFLTPRIITGDEPFLHMPDVGEDLKFRMEPHRAPPRKSARDLENDSFLKERPKQ